MAREVTVGRERARERRVVHRQDRPAPTSTCARRSWCSRRARWRSARLLLNSKSSKFPARARQLERHGRQVPHRHHRHRRRRVHPDAGGPRSAQRRRRRAAGTSTCRGGSTTRSSTSRAAITSRSGAGWASRVPASWAASSGIRTAAATASSSRTTTASYYGATIGFSGRGEMIPNDDSYCELDPTVDGPVRHSGAALPLEVDRPRVQPGRSTCRRPSAR